MSDPNNPASAADSRLATDPAMPDPASAAALDRRAFLGALAGAALAGTALAGEPALSPTPPALAKPRAGFLLPEDLTYLNNGTLGPCPNRVFDATIAAWRQLEKDPVTQGYGPLLTAMDETRAKATVLLGCSPDELAITDNTTQGMNAVAQGLRLQKNDRILTTDHEHPGGSVCWEYLAKRDGIVIDRVILPIPPQSADEIVTLFERAMVKETRVISVSHVTYTTGLRMPIARLAQLADAHHALLIVDGAQAPGVLMLNVSALNCSAYATSAHKWLLAPKGTGLLFIAKKAQGAIDPLLLSHGFGAYTAATGTRNMPAAIGLGAAITFILTAGQHEIESHSLALAKQARERLGRLPGCRVLSPAADALCSAMVTFAPPNGVNAETLVEALRAKHKIIVKPVSSPKVTGVRVSFHLYNTAADLDRLLEALGPLLSI